MTAVSTPSGRRSRGRHAAPRRRLVRFAPTGPRRAPAARRTPRPSVARATRRRRTARRPPSRWTARRLGDATASALARTLLAVIVVLLGSAWVMTDTAVTLSVDGEIRDVTTHAATVGALLDRADVEIGPRDKVVPDVETVLADGMVVEVVHAREITLLVGGRERTAIVTALSVDDVLQQLSHRVDLTSRSVVRPSRLARVRSGMTVEVRNPRPVEVVVGDARHDVITDATDVAGVLEGLGVDVGADDRVTPALDAPVERGMRIVVQRVTTKTRTRDVVLPYETIERSTSALPRGERRVVTAGAEGLAEVTEEVRIVDGEVVERERIGRTVVRPPRDEVVEVGTAEPAESDTPDSSADHSTGTSAGAGEPSDEPEPAADTDSGRSQSGEASYYHHPESGGFTAAHRTLPMGTVVTVTNRANGKTVRVTINDRGPFVEGRIIDLNKPAFEAIAAIESGVINVDISW